MCCLLVAELGATCGAPVRRCLAECCEQIVAAAASDLDERNSLSSLSDDDESTVARGGADASTTRKSTACSSSTMFGQLQTGVRLSGVREAACRALAVLAQEPGLAQRLAVAGAGRAVTHVMHAEACNREVQISCLETIEMLSTTTGTPGMWAQVSRWKEQV